MIIIGSEITNVKKFIIKLGIVLLGKLSGKRRDIRKNGRKRLRKRKKKDMLW